MHLARPATAHRRPFWPALLCACSLAWPLGSARAADTTCTALARAVRAGLGQQRIHAAIDVPLDGDTLKVGLKPMLVHSIVIDQMQYSNATRQAFHQVALKSAAERDLATDLAAFEAESGCRSLAAQRVAGRATQVFAFSTDLGRGEIRIKVWVDTASGLPVRALTDEPDVDVTTGFTKPGAGKGAPLKFEVKETPNGRRVVGTHAYLYGDAVKPLGARGAVDPAALAQLQALLKGAP